MSRTTSCNNFTQDQLEAARKLRNAKHKEWRDKNPDKVKAAQLRYWVKLSEKCKCNE